VWTLVRLSVVDPAHVGDGVQIGIEHVQEPRVAHADGQPPRPEPPAVDGLHRHVQHYLLVPAVGKGGQLAGVGGVGQE